MIRAPAGIAERSGLRPEIHWAEAPDASAPTRKYPPAATEQVGHVLCGEVMPVKLASAVPEARLHCLEGAGHGDVHKHPGFRSMLAGALAEL